MLVETNNNINETNEVILDEIETKETEIDVVESEVASIQDEQTEDDNIDIDLLDSAEEKKKRKKWSLKKKLIIITSIVLACLIALSTGVYFLLNWKPFKKTNAVTPAAIQTPKEIKAKSFSVLVCGIDYEEGTSRGHLTDIIMYVSIDVANDKVNILQIPRDTFIGLDQGVWTGKINGIYNRSSADGRENGIVGLAEYLSDEYKLPVDYYATVTMTTFKKVIDDIGGIEINVPQTFTLEGITIEAGLQTLNGVQAEKFVRNRGKGQAVTQYYDGSDTNRIKMQRLFIAALLKKFKNLSFDEVITAIKTCMPDVDSDMSIRNMTTLADILYNMPLENMDIDMVPGQDYQYEENGQWVYSLHEQQTIELLNEKYRPYTDKYYEEDLDLEELINTVSKNDNTVDNMDELLVSGIIPGQTKDTSSQDETPSSNTDSTASR